jgi:hypothetical protein
MDCRVKPGNDRLLLVLEIRLPLLDEGLHAFLLILRCEQ